jgi:energy-coupling factor transporter ATP-binding protein EcfA2
MTFAQKGVTEMTGSIRNFYASGNTAHGFASLFDSSIQGLERLFIVRGRPGTGKSTLIRTIGEHMEKNGYDVWLIHNPSDNGSLDGVIVPELKAGIVNGESTGVLQPQQAGIDLKYVNLDVACSTDKLIEHMPAIDRLNHEIERAYERSYAGFAEALRIHDEWEAIYIAHMDYQAANRSTNEYISRLYGDSDRKRDNQSRIDHRFLGAATPKGAVDFVPNLTEGLKRYFVKGRAGSGKSTMLKKLAAAGIERGFDVEMYHCGFDPNSLDMVIVRELGFAVFDSTAPHEYFPERPDDEIIDMYASCIKPGTDEAHAEAIGGIKERYSAKMKQSIQHLTRVKSLHDELKDLYVQSIDFRIVDQIAADVLLEFSGLAALQ